MKQISMEDVDPEVVRQVSAQLILSPDLYHATLAGDEAVSAQAVITAVFRAIQSNPGLMSLIHGMDDMLESWFRESDEGGESSSSE